MQQIAELRPVLGIDVIGEMPVDLQKQILALAILEMQLSGRQRLRAMPNKKLMPPLARPAAWTINQEFTKSLRAA